MRKSSCESWPRLALFLLFAVFGGLASAQSQQPPALVIEGGTLIDGNGGAPVQDSRSRDPREQDHQRIA